MYIRTSGSMSVHPLIQPSHRTHHNNKPGFCVPTKAVLKYTSHGFPPWNGKGNSIYPPAQAELRRRGIGGTAYTDFSGKRARQVTREDYEHYDYLLCADTANIRNTIRITGADTERKIRLLLDYTDRPGCSIADPWYSGNFEDTYRDVDAGCEGFLAYLKEKGAI